MQAAIPNAAVPTTAVTYDSRYSDNTYSDMHSAWSESRDKLYHTGLNRRKNQSPKRRFFDRRRTKVLVTITSPRGPRAHRHTASYIFCEGQRTDWGDTDRCSSGASWLRVYLFICQSLTFSSKALYLSFGCRVFPLRTKNIELFSSIDVI